MLIDFQVALLNDTASIGKRTTNHAALSVEAAQASIYMERVLIATNKNSADVLLLMAKTSVDIFILERNFRGFAAEFSLNLRTLFFFLF